VCGSVETFGCHDEVFAAVVAAAAKMFSWLRSKPNQTPAYSIEFSVVFPGFYHAPFPHTAHFVLVCKNMAKFLGKQLQAIALWSVFQTFSVDIDSRNLFLSS